MKKILSLLALLALTCSFASCDKEGGYPEVKSGFRINGKTVKVTESYYDRDDLSKGHIDIEIRLENGLYLFIQLDKLTSLNKKIDLTKPDPYFSLSEEEIDESRDYWYYWIQIGDGDDHHQYCWGDNDYYFYPGCPGSYLKVTGGKEVGDPLYVEFRLMHVSLYTGASSIHAATFTFKGKVEAEPIGGE